MDCCMLRQVQQRSSAVITRCMILVCGAEQLCLQQMCMPAQSYTLARMQHGAFPIRSRAKQRGSVAHLVAWSSHIVRKCTACSTATKGVRIGDD